MSLAYDIKALREEVSRLRERIAVLEAAGKPPVFLPLPKPAPDDFAKQLDEAIKRELAKQDIRPLRNPQFVPWPRPVRPAEYWLDLAKPACKVVAQ